jgi:hypothetical protein
MVQSPQPNLAVIIHIGYVARRLHGDVMRQGSRSKVNEASSLFCTLCLEPQAFFFSHDGNMKDYVFTE